MCSLSLRASRGKAEKLLSLCGSSGIEEWDVWGPAAPSTATVDAGTLARRFVGVVMGGDLADVGLRAGELERLHGRFVHRINRTEPRETALAYMQGLIPPLERKSGWTLAEQVGHAAPDRIHRLLNRIEWDADEVLDDVRDYVVEHLGDRDAVLIVDDTGFLKKGVRSAGVQRQYSGTAGACISISAL